MAFCAGSQPNFLATKLDELLETDSAPTKVSCSDITARTPATGRAEVSTWLKIRNPPPPATNPYVEKVKGALDEELRADRVRIQVRTGNAP
jgi:hypothetical protein